MEGVKTKLDIPVMESFYSIQGEGFHSGKAAYFIRLAGCDVGCVWCDVKDSWDSSPDQNVEISTLVALAVEEKSSIAIITGGEPTIYNLAPLTESLQKERIRTHLETSGVNQITGSWDWICLSPKKFKPPLQTALAMTDEFKVVVYHESDIKWSQQFLPFLKEDCKLLLQPEWSKRKSMEPIIVDYCKSNPEWGISLQTHKYLEIR